jgi:hypothetical protein
VVRHEAGVDAQGDRRSGTGLLILMAIVGLTAFAGAVGAFLRGRAAGAGDMTIAAWVLALIGVSCVAISVYFLLKRIGGVED